MKCTKCQAQWELPENKVSQLATCPFCGASIELPQQEKLDSFKAVIASITSRFGVDLLLDRNKAMAYFVDLAPSLKKERQMFQYLLLCDGNIQIIQSLSSSADEQIACRHKISARMIEDFFIGKEIADQICDDFWHAIGGDAGSDDQFAADFERAGNLNHFDSPESDKKEAFNEGIGVGQDFTLAANWFTKAAEAGDKNAMYTLGKWYAEGVNLDADMEKARMYMTSASEKGVSEAAQWLVANPLKDSKPKWAFWKKSKP